MSRLRGGYNFATTTNTYTQTSTYTHKTCETHPQSQHMKGPYTLIWVFACVVRMCICLCKCIGGFELFGGGLSEALNNFSFNIWAHTCFDLITRHVELTLTHKTYKEHATRSTRWPRMSCECIYLCLVVVIEFLFER